MKKKKIIAISVLAALLAVYLVISIPFLGYFPSLLTEKRLNKIPNPSDEVFQGRDFSTTHHYASENLIPLKCTSQNSEFFYEVSYEHDSSKYYSISGVSVEDFVFEHIYSPFSTYASGKMRIAHECTIDPIMQYNVVKAEVFWSYDKVIKTSDTWTYGSDIFAESAFITDHEAVLNVIREMNDALTATKEELTESINTGNPATESSRTLKIRLYFEECENLVWDGEIVTLDGAYYVKVNPMRSSLFRYVLLNSELCDQLDAYFSHTEWH